MEKREAGHDEHRSAARRDHPPGLVQRAFRPRKAHVLGGFGGWALDAMDVQLYGLVIPTLIATRAISNTQAGLLATVALLLSAVGGWIAGLLADRIGRVRTLQITILWFSFFTFRQRVRAEL